MGIAHTGYGGVNATTAFTDISEDTPITRKIVSHLMNYSYIPFP